MSNIVIQKAIDVNLHICANIGCINALGFFDVKKGRRFCRKCKNFGKPLEWHCEGCKSTISNSSCRTTRRFCYKCRGLVNRNDKLK